MLKEKRLLFPIYKFLHFSKKVSTLLMKKLYFFQMKSLYSFQKKICTNSAKEFVQCPTYYSYFQAAVVFEKFHPLDVVDELLVLQYQRSQLVPLRFGLQLEKLIKFKKINKSLSF